jgi:hypothetical protein
MLGSIINLIFNSLITGFAIIGAGTVVNKAGDFFKVLENEKEDAYKKAFDSVMVESIGDLNKSVDSVQSISRNFYKILFIVIEILNGSKYIKKKKDGKIIICDKSKISGSYKEKIEELKNKVNKYREELIKVKGTGSLPEEDDTGDAGDTGVIDDDLSDTSEIIETSFASTKNNEFFLEKKNY